jgi:hypothetical protein
VWTVSQKAKKTFLSAAAAATAVIHDQLSPPATDIIT